MPVAPSGAFATGLGAWELVVGWWAVECVGVEAPGGVEGVGAVVVDEEVALVRAGPQVGAGFDDGVVPAGVGLGAVVSPAQGHELTGTCRSAVGVRLAVVDVAVAGIAAEYF